jgi:glycine dehydrogenase
MVADLTGLPVAGASMLDEATAAAEAMTLVRRAGRPRPTRSSSSTRTRLPQTLAVLRTRAEPLGIGLHVADLSAGWPTDLPEAGAFGVLLSYPGPAAPSATTGPWPPPRTRPAPRSSSPPTCWR